MQSESLSSEKQQQVEEDIEKKERKLRIAVRKNKAEKIVKLNKELDDLRAQLRVGESPGNWQPSATQAFFP